MYTNHGLYELRGRSSWAFKIDDSKNAIVKATKKYLHRILNALEAVCGKSITIK